MANRHEDAIQFAIRGDRVGSVTRWRRQDLAHDQGGDHVVRGSALTTGALIRSVPQPKYTRSSPGLNQISSPPTPATVCTTVPFAISRTSPQLVIKRCPGMRTSPAGWQVVANVLVIFMVMGLISSTSPLG